MYLITYISSELGNDTARIYGEVPSMEAAKFLVDWFNKNPGRHFNGSVDKTARNYGYQICFQNRNVADEYSLLMKNIEIFENNKLKASSLGRNPTLKRDSTPDWTPQHFPQGTIVVFNFGRWSLF